MRQKERKSEKIPKGEDREKFWSKMWSEGTTHNEKAGWIVKEEERAEGQIEEMNDHITTTTELKKIQRKSHKWKTDIQNFSGRN